MSKKPVSFCIPLASKTDETSWATFNQCLGYTLRSVLNQTDPDFEVFVCSHDKPSVRELEDPRVHFLFANGPRATGPTDFTGDKARKKLQIVAQIVKRSGSYVVMHDADDLIHCDLVSFVRDVGNPHGYTYPLGYVMDFQDKYVAPVPGAWGKPFSDLCGSSAVIWLNPEDTRAPKGERSYIREFKRHSEWAQVASSFGRPFAEVPFGCCIYMQNNAVNMSLILQGREKRIQEIVKRIRKHKLDVTPSFVRNFAIEWAVSDAEI